MKAKIGKGYKAAIRAESKRLRESGANKTEIRAGMEIWKKEYWGR